MKADEQSGSGPEQTAALLRDFIQQVRKYLSTDQARAIQANTLTISVPPTPGSPAETKRNNDIFDLSEKYQQVRADLLKLGERVTVPLHKHGHDVRGLCSIMHAADGGGGPEAVRKLWPGVKVDLEAVALELEHPRQQPVENQAKTTTANAKKNKGGRPGISKDEAEDRMCFYNTYLERKGEGATLKMVAEENDLDHKTARAWKSWAESQAQKTSRK